MRVIIHLHDFICGLPAPVRAEVMRLSNVRTLAKGETVYRQGDPPTELYRVLEGAVKLCNYSLDGGEIVMGELRQGDCFGEMGLIDGLPRVSHAATSSHSRISVLSKQHFDMLRDKHPEFNREISVMLCRRVRLLWTLSEDATALKLHERLARILHRLSYSHHHEEGQSASYIEISHDELARMLGASRQSVSKELKSLEHEGDIELRYGKIYILDLDRLAARYEKAIGLEQVAPTYDNV